MSSQALTAIYYNKKRNNNLYVVIFQDVKNTGLEKLSESKQSYNEEEKALLRKFAESNDEYEDYLDTIDSWLNLTYQGYKKSMTYARILDKVVSEYNESGKTAQVLDRIIYIYDFSRDYWKKERNQIDKEIIDKEIDYKELVLIAESEKKLEKEEVLELIKESRLKDVTEYAVMMCPVCQKYRIHIVRNLTIGECSSCHELTPIGETIYQGNDIYLAGLKATNQNSGSESVEHNKPSDIYSFEYKGKPYKSFKSEQETLHDLIYKERDGDAIFYMKDGKVYFKLDYIRYASALESPFPKIINEAVRKLEEYQYDLSEEYFSTDVALYWYYRAYKPGSKYLKDTYPLFIRKKNIFFKSVKEYIDAFASSSEEECRFLYTLLNPIYLEYFFVDADNNPLFLNNSTQDKCLTLEKLIYESRKEFIYIDENDRHIYKFGKYFLDDLIIDDENNIHRYNFLSFISLYGNPSDFGLPPMGLYEAKLPGCYDYNCYIYSLYRDDGYYYFKDLVLPLSERARTVITSLIEKRYINPQNRKIVNDFNDLVTLYQKKILNVDLTIQLEAIVRTMLEGIDKDLSNFDEIYFRAESTKKPTTVSIRYQDEIGTLYEHTCRAFEKDELCEFIKDKTINNIITSLYRDKKNKIYENAEKSFNDMTNRIKSLLERK